jgi:hypothetical protein
VADEDGQVSMVGSIGSLDHRAIDLTAAYGDQPVMAPLATIIGVLLIIIAIPFGLMLAPLALGVIVVALAWRHVSASWEPVAGSAS